MRHLRNLLFFLVGFLVIAVPMLSYAETIAATGPNSQPATELWRVGNTGAYTFPTWLAAATAYYNAATHPVNPSMYSKVNGPWSDTGCSQVGGASSYGVTVKIRWENKSTHVQECRDHGVGMNAALACTVGTLSGSTCTGIYTCPSGQNWTLSGATCTRPDCAPGETRQANGTCVNTCASKAGQPDAFYTGTSVCGKGQMPSATCLGGCVIEYGTGVGFGTDWCQTVGKYTGAACSGTVPEMPTTEGNGGDGSVPQEGERLPSDSPEKKCVDQGMGFGRVNGVVVCVGPDVKKTTSDKNVEQKDQNGNSTGNTTTKTETTYVKNPDGSVTKVITVTNPDGTKTVTTETGKGDGSRTGDGDGGGSRGDGMGTPPEETPLQEKAIGPSAITPVTIGGAGSCPAPVALPHNRGSISFDHACDLAGMIKPITLAFAWLAAVLIAVGGFKDG